MNFHKDTEFMALMGLPSPFIAADALYSPITESSMMTHRVFPGLCGFVPCGDAIVAGVFVDELPDDDRLRGVIMLTTRTDSAGESQECWLVQLQSRTNAWQFMTVDEFLPSPDEWTVLFKWKPGALSEGYEMHDAMVAGLAGDDDFWLVGSELEKQAYSRFVLSTGTSSFAHPYQANGMMSLALNNLGELIPITKGPSTEMRAYQIDWHQA
jgi:hypothetical protein